MMKTFTTNKLLEGKKGLIMGVANDKSLAWHIAKICSMAGAELLLTYQGEMLLQRVNNLAKEINCKDIIECDASNSNAISNTFEKVKEKFGKLDFLVHAIAFSDRHELEGRYIDTTLDNFLNTMNISCYSFTSAAKHAAELMDQGGSILTLTYYGAEKVIPNYNVMGVAKSALECSVRYIASDLGPRNIRVNAISSGPIKTLASSGIKDFKHMLNWTAQNTPMRKNITGENVGGGALYLLSELSEGVTGEIMHIDNGYHIIGMHSKNENQ